MCKSQKLTDFVFVCVFGSLKFQHINGLSIQTYSTLDIIQSPFISDRQTHSSCCVHLRRSTFQPFYGFVFRSTEAFSYIIVLRERSKSFMPDSYTLICLHSDRWFVCSQATIIEGNCIWVITRIICVILEQVFDVCHCLT